MYHILNSVHLVPLGPQGCTGYCRSYTKKIHMRSLVNIHLLCLQGGIEHTVFNCTWSYIDDDWWFSCRDRRKLISSTGFQYSSFMYHRCCRTQEEVSCIADQVPNGELGYHVHCYQWSLTGQLIFMLDAPCWDCTSQNRAVQFQKWSCNHSYRFLSKCES